jgi:hypothetical protein
MFTGYRARTAVSAGQYRPDRAVADCPEAKRK